MRAPRPPISPQARMKPRMERSFSVFDELSGARWRLWEYIILEEEDVSLEIECYARAMIILHWIGFRTTKVKAVWTIALWSKEVLDLPVASTALSLSLFPVCLSLFLLVEMLLLCSSVIVIFHLEPFSFFSSTSFLLHFEASSNYFSTDVFFYDATLVLYILGNRKISFSFPF